MRLILLPFLTVAAVLLASPLAGAQSPLLPVETLRPAYGTNDDDDYGFSVAVGEQWIAVGAPETYVNGTTRAGAVYLYQWRDDDWVLAERLVSPEPAVSAFFGARLALNDSTLVVSSTNAPNPSGTGNVFVFRFHERWTHTQTILSPKSGVVQFGRGVAVGDTTLVIGTGPIPPGANGQAYVYTRELDRWRLRDSLQVRPDAPDWYYGETIRLSESRIVIRSRSQRTVDIFEAIDGTWIRTNTLNGTGDPDLHDDRLIMGADWRNTDNAAAYLFEWNGSEWTRTVLPLPSSQSRSNALANAVCGFQSAISSENRSGGNPSA